MPPLTNKPIYVTETFLPNIQEYIDYLEKVWNSKWITNNGQYAKELENKLKDYLGVKHLFFVSNGTIALQIAIKALDLKGEIITTPFSYVATTSSIIWEGCKPVFADIDPKTLTIDPKQIEEKITTKTSAIVATHVYGIPCNVGAIEEIARKHNLRVIYDAAHAFGVKYKGSSVLNYGDISTLSFHATKLFHTGEGGAVITNSDELAHKISYMRNFGHKTETEFWGVGINGKNSELHAAMGLCVLPHVDKIIESRKKTTELYDSLLLTKGSKLKKPAVPSNTTYNYAYYPIIFPSEKSLLNAVNSLNQNEIFPRRYFYPSLNNLPYVNSDGLTESERISKRTICLPLFFGMKEEIVYKISSIIKKSLDFHNYLK
jgi:dTDP-4-amino-4,6-dideoxygalactose transaminase